MTNMPDHQDTGGYKSFAIVTSTVCIPFLILIGSLNTHRGMNWWRHKTKIVFAMTSEFCIWVAHGGPFNREPPEDPEFPRTRSFESSASGIKPLEPTLTMSGETMRRRQRRLSGRKDPRGFDNVPEPTSRGDPTGMAETGNGALRPPTQSGGPTTPTTPPPLALTAMLKNEKRQRLRYSEDV